ncbi:kinase-like domain-containing protein [Suillus clintonianus]|uniref:kinase-like domain-containing protein n=1 Tax=Suillus clintonianus TaxID=1904413 RepID=UPI001B862D6F|nr:kinase-like domain-containing protein [Suillus clintonianus]KAG2146626.1 kinase-like domain-containing protein [Suillus clintonianus]
MANLAAQALMGAAQTAAQFAPVPWLGAATGVLVTLINMFATAEANKNGITLLQDRCLNFMSIINNEGQNLPPDQQARLCSSAQGGLQNILDKMAPWCSMSRVKLFVRQDELAGTIQQCHADISDCLLKLQVTSHLSIHAWQINFDLSRARDKDDMVQYLGDIKNQQELMRVAQMQHTAELREIMKLMQKNLPGLVPTTDRGMESNLYHIQHSSHSLLPNMHLRRGEVKRIGQYAVKGTGTADIWEGYYLNEEKVSIKILRAVNCDHQSLRRFRREVDIWIRVWEADHGEHILPFYGFCQTDGPFPYVVSPWMVNGTVDEYIKKYPTVDHYSLIKGICEGLNVLHSMSPAIVHGDLKASNIVVDVNGNPLLADFGFAKVLEDVTGVSFTMSAGVSNSQRWLAPELCRDAGMLTTHSDIFAYGMTILEIMTHEIPWHHIRHTTHVIIKLSRGEMPPRPKDPAASARGLDDRLWLLVQKCWSAPENRPSTRDILAFFG